MANEIKLIPYAKATRVGNYKLWRSKMSVSVTPTDDQRNEIRRKSNGKERAVTRKFDIDVINVSNLDGSFKVQIPATSEMFGLICQQYNEGKSGEEFLGMVFANFLNVCTNANPVLHDGMFFLTQVITYPYLLLPEKEMVSRMRAVYKQNDIEKKEADKQIDEMTEYRKKLYALIDEKIGRLIEDYEQSQADRRAQEEAALQELEREEVADEAAEALAKEDKK